MGAWGLIGGEATSGGDPFQLAEEPFAVVGLEDLEDLGLEGDGDDAAGVELGVPCGKDSDPVGASVGFVGETFDPARGLHPFEEGSDGIGIGGHERGEFALGETVGVGLDEGAEGGELVRGDAGMGDATAEALVESVPGFPEERGEATDLGGRILGGWIL